ncbi:MAG: response regulator [Armatimonadetes bacterium]|nr:response regulator [Armatimonadota bacterium]
MDGRKPRVLFVDDDVIERKVVELTLKGAFQVTVIGSGTDALKLLADEPYDCLLVDMRMPDLDGDEVIRRGTALQPDIRPVVLSAYIDGERASELESRGIPFVKKPFQPHLLLQTLLQALSIE